MKYISLDTVLASLSRELKQYPVSEGEVIEWCADALEVIQTPSVYENAIAYIEVAQHQCVLPKHLHIILQVARNNNWKNIHDSITAKIITDPNINTPDIPVALDENGTPINEYELAYYRPYFDLIAEYSIINSHSSYFSHFTPVRLANQVFFGTVVAKETDFETIYSSCQDEYTIVDNVLRFSFETGQVAISYLRQKLDCETGYPMLPDTIENKTAVIAYVRYKLKEIDFYQNRQGSDSRLAKSESDWHWYCSQAKNSNMMPQTIDEWENLMRQRSYIMPQTNRYYGFFGKLAHDENRNLMHYGRK